MAESKLPPGPPPARPPTPPVPAGWTAVWSQQDQRWYYVEQVSGKAVWDLPGTSLPPPPPHPEEKPPSYEQSTPASAVAIPANGVKGSPFATTSPNPGGDASSSSAPPPIPDSTKPGGDEKAPLPFPAATENNNSTYDADAKLAAELQAQEDARAHAFASPPPAFPNQLPPRAGPEKSSRSHFSLGRLLRGKKTPTQQHAFMSPPQP
ncbi:hypothetical protein MAPG_08592, partial [Magnaporthiopsis poae ATCC 64411]